jgi:hypothetical protein
MLHGGPYRDDPIQGHTTGYCWHEESTITLKDSRLNLFIEKEIRSKVGNSNIRGFSTGSCPSPASPVSTCSCADRARRKFQAYHIDRKCANSDEKFVYIQDIGLEDGKNWQLIDVYRLTKIPAVRNLASQQAVSNPTA